MQFAIARVLITNIGIMKRSPLIKAVTLCSFFGLLALFLMYRTGRLDNYIYSDEASLQTSPNGGPLHASKEDSIKHRRDSMKKVRMSSSKSGAVTDDIRMYSSKSGAVFTPRAEADSTKADTSKSKASKQK